MRIHACAAIIVFAALAAGCGKQGPVATNEPAPEKQVQARPDQAAPVPVPVAGNKAVWLDPAALPNCADPAKVTVHWDARAFDGVKSVEIMAVDRKGKQSLFFAGGRVGSRETGAWMKSGAQMVLRNADNRSELARAVVTGMPCVDGVPSDAGGPVPAGEAGG